MLLSKGTVNEASSSIYLSCPKVSYLKPTLYLKVSKEVDDIVASGRQFQSAIVFGKNENLKTSLFA